MKTLTIDVPANVTTIRLKVTREWKGNGVLLRKGSSKPAAYLARTGRWLPGKPGRKSNRERAKGKA